MGQMGQEDKRRRKREEVVGEYFRGGWTYRELEARYGVPTTTIHRWVKEFGEAMGPEELRKGAQRRQLAVKESEPSSDVRELRRELEEARLYNKLLNTMIDLAEDQMGIDIRKKRGAK